MNSPHKGPVMQKAFPCNNVIMNRPIVAKILVLPIWEIGKLVRWPNIILLTRLSILPLHWFLTFSVIYRNVFYMTNRQQPTVFTLAFLLTSRYMYAKWLPPRISPHMECMLCIALCTYMTNMLFSVICTIINMWSSIMILSVPSTWHELIVH